LPTVSVVIATFARPSALRRALASLTEQSQPAEEVIVAAWDKDGETIAAIAQHPSVRQILVSQNTLSAKENAAIGAAVGEIVAFMDDDAVAQREWLAKLRAHYDDASVIGVGGRDVVNNDGVVDDREASNVGQVSWFGRLTGNHHLRIKGIREVQFLKGCNMSYRRSAIVPVDPRLKGDVPYAFELDMGLEARRKGRLVYDPAVVVDHFPSVDMSPHRPSIALVLNHNVTYILLKHLGWPRRLCFLAYTFLVGDRDTIGLLRVPLLIGRAGWTPAVVATHFRGKLSGVVSFLKWLRTRGRQLI
jgi:GT2 family glycosyltransferase